MKAFRNLLFTAAAALFLTTPSRVHASPGLACGTGPGGCGWGPDSCCDVSNDGYDCPTLCGYCFDEAGNNSGTYCTASVSGQMYSGSICQCEAPSAWQ